MGDIDPLRDIEIINLELILADLETVTKKRKNNITREVRRGDKEAILEDEALAKLIPVLESGKLANTISFTEKEIEKVKQLGLLTMKPFIYSLNKRAGANNLDTSNLKKYLKNLQII